MITIRPYTSEDVSWIEGALEHLQAHITALDPQKRLRMLPGFGKVYFAQVVLPLLEKEGALLLAEHEGQRVGFIVGAIERRLTDEWALGYIPCSVGGVAELYVDEAQRSLGIGKKLMEAMEDYFREQQCDASSV